MGAFLFFPGYLVTWKHGSQHEGSYRYMCDSYSLSLCRSQFSSLLPDGSSLDPFPRIIWNRCCGACTGTSSCVWRNSQVFQPSLHSLVCRHVRSYRPSHGEIIPSLIWNCLKDSLIRIYFHVKAVVAPSQHTWWDCQEKKGLFQIKPWGLHGT